MSCVVSVQKTCIEDGRLLFKDIDKIWSNYDKSLHEWMLKLTEEFDLTYAVGDKEMSIVPCLLPDKEPDFEWPEIIKDNSNYSNKAAKIKEFQVVYSFAYIPAGLFSFFKLKKKFNNNKNSIKKFNIFYFDDEGLFNRIQVRLFNYADNTKIWKNGSLLKKNNHLALINQSKNLLITVRVQGTKPENIIFLIHEVIETLIKESFQGIKYDYSFPCPECVDAQSADPFLFSSALLRRASEFKAPYLQCHKNFHAISIQEMMSMMPIDGASTLDLNLEYSLRDLKQMKKNLKYDIAFWYCHHDIFADAENQMLTPKINPLQIIQDILSLNYKVKMNILYK